MASQAVQYDLYFRRSVKNIKKQTVVKLKEANTARSNYNNPHYRRLVLPNISRSGYEYLFRKHHSDKVRESSTKTSSPLYVILSVERLQVFFPTESLIKFHFNGDATIITPFSSISSYLFSLTTTYKRVTVEAGKLVLPIKETNDKVQVFFLCSGLNEMNKVPDWVDDFYPNQLLDGVNPSCIL